MTRFPPDFTESAPPGEKRKKILLRWAKFCAILTLTPFGGLAMIDESYESRIGKKPNQKLKAYLIMKYLLEHADDAHAVSAETIV